MDATASFANAEELSKVLESSGITAQHSGTSTPYHLLLTLTREVAEVRRVQEEQTRQSAAALAVLQQQLEQSVNVSKTLAAQLEEAKSQSATLNAMLRAMDRPMSMHASQPQAHARTSVPGKTLTAHADREYYYEGEKVSTGAGVVAVVLMQVICAVTDSHMSTAHPDLTNDNTLSFKEMRSVVDAVCKVAPSIQLPRLANTATQETLRHVASTDPSIPTRCTPQHISEVSRECSQVTSVVEQARLRILKCGGVVGPYQQACLSYVRYPYASGNDMLGGGGPSPTSVVHNMRLKNNNLRRLKAMARNVYIGCMLSGKTYGESFVEATRDPSGGSTGTRP